MRRHLALAELQDLEPRFAAHVYAISSVSGGSVGAALFASLHSILGSNLNGRGGLKYSALVERYFANDFLAPVVASMFGAGLFQQFLPFRVFFIKDRGEALERGFEKTWESFAFSRNPLSESVESLSRMRTDTPRIVFNTTNVETGLQMVISSFANPSFGSNNLLDYLQTRTLRVSTAMIASARFPYVSPAGIVDVGSRQPLKRSFVDGGYIDNTGTTTLSRLIGQVRITALYRPSLLPIRIIPIFIRHVHDRGAQPLGELFSTDRVKFAGTNEIATPIKTVLAAMNQASTTARDAYTWKSKVPDSSEPRATVESPREVITSDEYGEVPLGWSLSNESRNRIRERLRISLALKQDQGAVQWKEQFVPRPFSEAENVIYRAGGGLAPEDLLVGTYPFMPPIHHPKLWLGRNPFTAPEPELNQILDLVSGTLLLDGELRSIERNTPSGYLIYNAWKSLCRLRKIRNCTGAILVQSQIANEYMRIRRTLTQVPTLDRLKTLCECAHQRSRCGDGTFYLVFESLMTAKRQGVNWIKLASVNSAAQSIRSAYVFSMMAIGGPSVYEW
jgi:hypothetical protein